MSETLRPDICVIGAGSGGLSVAAAATAFGVSVVLIERAKMGGDCLNHGCVPSKALLAAAMKAHVIRSEAGAFGIATSEPQIDFRAVMDHVRGVIAAIAPHDSVGRYRAMGVHVIEATARFTGKATVEAGGTLIKARRFVVATGSSPAIPPIAGLDRIDYLTNETLFDLTERPDHLIVVGGGPVGMEMSQAFRRLGAKVSVLEAGAFFSQGDPELSELVLRQIRAEGIDLHAGAEVTGTERLADGRLRVTFRQKSDRDDGGAGEEQAIEGSHLLIAAGRRPNIDALDLEAGRIDHDPDGLVLDKSLRSRSNRRVYGVGDVAGRQRFTHVAGYHAGQVIRSILFRLPGRPDPSILPSVIFTDPPLAQIGLSEAGARDRHGDAIAIRRWPFTENDRAQAERRTHGVLKMIIAKDRIVGVSIAGVHADEMINLWALAIERGMKPSDVAGFVPPYPIVGEAGKRAATDHLSALAKNRFVRGTVGLLRRLG